MAVVYINNLTASIHLTNHATHRLKERCGLPKKAHERNALTALDKGIRREECPRALRNYLTGLYLSHGNGNNIRVYNNHAYVFCDESLITVLRLPKEYRAATNKTFKRRGRLAMT